MVKMLKIHKIIAIVSFILLTTTQFAIPSVVYAYQCGRGENAVEVGFNIGCRGESYPRSPFNPVIDMAFALFRFLSLGVGLIVIGSIIVAGIQYSASRGNPQATQAAINRITNALAGLVLYMFIFAIANFLIPGGILI